MSRFYITTAIDYVNSRPHLGTAYEKVCADVIARYKRLAGFDVRFVMGNDEHSQNVYRQAVELGLDPVAYCDRMEREFIGAWRRLDVSFDDFIRTTEPRHKRGVTEIIERIHRAGDIYEGLYEGWYCVSCEEFKQEKDLVNGNCPLHPTLTPEWLREKNYFFRLSKYQPALLELVRTRPAFIQPESRRNEILRLLEGGLIDISVSRAGQSWGIPLPFDSSSVVYVWFDALVNYASAVGLGTDAALFDRWWPADLHVIGKDITRFHAVIWPAMLMSAGLAVPEQIFGHGFMTIGGQRMSKSIPGTIVDPVDAAERRGHDPLRLYLVKEVPFGGDGDFSWDRFDERYNVDLANNLGNLVSRVTSMGERYRQGRLTAAPAPERLMEAVETNVRGYREAMDRFAIDVACQHAFRIVDASNECIAASEPWALAKAGREAELDGVLWGVSEALRVVAVLLQPVMPQSSAAILARVGDHTPVSDLRLAQAASVVRDGSRTLTHGEALWPRVDPAGPATRTAATKEKISVTEGSNVPGAAPPAHVPAAAAAASAADQAAVPSASAPSRLSLEDFMKVDLRVARVLTAERVPKSKKLMKLHVDLGSEQRVIVAGIADAYEADALVGRSIVIVANLEPAKLMGIESNGMVLAGSPDGGKPVLLGFDNPPPPGSRVR